MSTQHAARVYCDANAAAWVAESSAPYTDVNGIIHLPEVKIGSSYVVEFTFPLVAGGNADISAATTVFKCDMMNRHGQDGVAEATFEKLTSNKLRVNFAGSETAKLLPGTRTWALEVEYDAGEKELDGTTVKLHTDGLLLGRVKAVRGDVK
jgi:hypothetical protein